MKHCISITIAFIIIALLATFSNAASYSQTETEWSGDLYQRRLTFDFGVSITGITQANLETNVYDIEDAQGDHIDIQLNIEGYNVPGAFDDVDLRFTTGTVSFNLLNLLGVNALEDICSDGIVIVDFLNAGSYMESYSINWVSLSIEVGTASAPFFDVLTSFPSPASSPRGLAWDGEYLWHCSGAGGHFIYKLDVSGNIVNQYDWPYSESYGMAFDGEDVWIVDNSSDYIYEYSTDWQLLSSFPIPDFNGTSLHGTGLAWDGTFLWLSSGYYDSNNYLFKLTTSGEILESYHPVNEQLADLAWDGEYLWATSTYNHKIYQINTNGEVVQTFDLGNQNPNGITYDGNFLWYVDREPNKMIYQIQVVSGSTTSTTTTTIVEPTTTTTTAIDPVTTTTVLVTTTVPGTEMYVDFMVSPTLGSAPLTVYFTNLSHGDIESYSWNFGDGSTSTELNPGHTYPSMGSYGVSLTAYGTDGNSNSRAKPNCVIVIPPLPCGFSTALDSKEDINTLRTLRDSMLNNVFGIIATCIYYQNSAEVASILAENPELQDKIKELVSKNIDVAINLINGDKTSLPKHNVDEVIEFLKGLIEEGSLKLKADINLVIEAVGEGYFLYGLGVNVE